MAHHLLTLFEVSIRRRFTEVMSKTKLKVEMLSFKLVSSQFSIQMGLLIPLNLADCQLQKCCFKPILGYLAEHQPWNSAATVGGIVIS